MKRRKRRSRFYLIILFFFCGWNVNHIVFCIISQTGAGDDTVYLEPSLNLPHCSRVHSEKEGRKQASKQARKSVRHTEEEEPPKKLEPPVSVST